MDANTTCNVADLFGRDKEALEHLLGTPLRETQKVCIVAFTPGQEPDPQTRLRAADAIETLLDSAGEHSQRQGVSDEQIDRAVDEAMNQVRRRSPA